MIKLEFTEWGRRRQDSRLMCPADKNATCFPRKSDPHCKACYEVYRNGGTAK